MSSLFAILFLISIVLLIWGLISPKSLSKQSKKPITRRDAGIGFGFLTILFSILTSVTAPPQNNKNISQASQHTSSSIQQINSSSAQHASNITKKTVTENQSIPFDKTTVNSSSLASGTSEITTTGVAGEKTLTYEITYTDGKQTDKKLIKEDVTKQPVDQVTSMGTYVASTQKVTASSPVVSKPPSSNPLGATAKCRDGTYSYSQHHQGTCSHHGGVAVWL